VAARFQVQVQITVAAALALAAARICYARLADATQARNHCAAFGIALKIFLNRSQHSVSGVTGEPMKFPRERRRFDELHIVIVPQCDIQSLRIGTCDEASETRGSNPKTRFKLGTWGLRRGREDPERIIGASPVAQPVVRWEYHAKRRT
jgi:hypothetical protein